MLSLKEILVEKIKCFERELVDEKFCNKIFNGMVDIMDNEYGVGFRKKYLFGMFGKLK